MAAVPLSLDGRRFRDTTATRQGDVGDGTEFHYRQRADEVWATYSGGAVRHGFLVGTCEGDRLSFRYAHLTVAGDTASGRCTSEIETLDDGRVRLHESWSWASRPGSGTSTLEEVDAIDPGAPILEHAVLDVVAGEEARFEAALDEALPLIAARPGFRSLQVQRCVEQPSRYLLLVEWEQLEDHTEGFRGSPEYERWRRLLHHFYDPFPVVEHFEPLVRVQGG